MADEAAVLKAAKLASAAKRCGWHGTFDSTEAEGERRTVLDVARNDESMKITYIGNSMHPTEYRLLTRTWNIQSASEALVRLEGWPDLIKMFKWFPNANRPNLVETYRSLPFSMEDSNESIIEKLIGTKLFWYCHTGQKINVDVVMQPRKSDGKNFRIADVGHRKLFHFIGAQCGFRSVILDTIIKVG